MNLIDHIHRQMRFSLQAFGPGSRQKGVVDHIRKELVEIEEGDNDHEEWVDAWLLSTDGLWRSVRDNPKFSDLTDREVAEMICDRIDRKQSKNERRVWPDWRTQSPDAAIEHVRGIED